jgi:hypothetical protein
VESFFTKLTRRRLKRGVFESIKDLKAAINRFVAKTNAKPEPFWPADPRRCETWETSVRVGPLVLYAGYN